MYKANMLYCDGVGYKTIPAKESLWFNYKKLPKSTEQRWEVNDIIELVYPKEFAPKSKEIAAGLINFICDNKGWVNGDILEEWRKKNEFSNSTLRNLVIPKLIRMGMLVRKRRDPTGRKLKDKRHRMVLGLSKRFGMAFKRIGDEYNAIVGTHKEEPTPDV